MNENYQNNEPTKKKIETKQDVQKIQEELKAKLNKIIDEAPKLSLEIKNAPYYLNLLFEQDGTPKADFRVSDRYKRSVAAAFKQPHRKSTTGEIYWGKLLIEGFGKDYPVEYLIEVTPTFLTDEELNILQHKHKIVKKIGNTDIEFVPPEWQRDNYSIRTEKYRKTIPEYRRKIQEINDIITELETLKTKLPMGSYTVIIDQNESPKNKNGYPHK